MNQLAFRYIGKNVHIAQLFEQKIFFFMNASTKML